MDDLEQLLARLRAEGIQVQPDGDQLVVSPASKLTDDLRSAILTHKTELLRRSFCSRCGLSPRSLVTAYWDPSERFCSACCQVVAREFDEDDAWPPVPWRDNEVPR